MSMTVDKFIYAVSPHCRFNRMLIDVSDLFRLEGHIRCAGFANSAHNGAARRDWNREIQRMQPGITHDTSEPLVAAIIGTKRIAV